MEAHTFLPCFQSPHHEIAEPFSSDHYGLAPLTGPLDFMSTQEEHPYSHTDDMLGANPCLNGMEIGNLGGVCADSFLTHDSEDNQTHVMNAKISPPSMVATAHHYEHPFLQGLPAPPPPTLFHPIVAHHQLPSGPAPMEDETNRAMYPSNHYNNTSNGNISENNSNSENDTNSGGPDSTDGKPTRKRSTRKRKKVCLPDDMCVSPAPLPDPTMPLDPAAFRELQEQQLEKKKRLARKAELARMSRKRKKTRMSDLEKEVERLKAELEQVKGNVKEDNVDNVKPEIKSELTVQQALTRLIDAVNLAASQPHTASGSDNEMSGHSSPVPEQKPMGELVEEMMFLLNKRVQSADQHVSALEDSVGVSCMPVRFLQWIVTQNEKFYRDPTGLWASLFRQEIGATDEQMSEIITLRDNFRQQPKAEGELEEAYKRFATLLRTQLGSSTLNLGKLQSILTPYQFAKFCSWVDRFGHICVQINL